MIYLIILCLKKLAPKLLKPKKRTETKFSCKTRIKKGQKVGVERNLETKREITKKNITKPTLSPMRTWKWNMDHMALNLLETTMNNKNWQSMENGNRHYIKIKLKSNLTK